MTNALIGKRVELVACADPYTRLTPGEQGTVTHVDDLGTVSVRWDSGSTLGMIQGEDAWKEVEEVDRLDQTSEELYDALGSTLQLTFGRAEPILCYVQHTGGGCMVAVIDLSHDGRGIGRQLWLTRDDDKAWILGFYDFTDPDDEGVCVTLNGYYVHDYREGQPPERRHTADSPQWVAAQVAGILSRLGVDTLQGE